MPRNEISPRIEVVHAIPRRTRLRFPRRKFQRQQHAIGPSLHALPGVESVRLNPFASCAVVDHRESITADDLLQLLREALGFDGEPSPSSRVEKHPAPADDIGKSDGASNGDRRERSLYAESLDEKIRRVALASAFLPFFFVRRPLFAGPLFSGPLGGFFTIPGFASLLLSAPVIKSGVEVLFRTGRPNADTLTATGVVSSLAAGQDTSALAIVWLTEVAELLTEYTMGQTRRAIGELLSTGETSVWRRTPDGGEEAVPIGSIQVGDRIVVHTGEKVSVDGCVEEGEAAVDQASITGEFMPLHKTVGSNVFGGTVVKSGRLVVRAEKVGDETAAARIVQLVEQASEQRSPIQSFSDQVAGQLIPVHFAMALGVYLLTRNPTRALTMLVIDYSCSLRLSTATALSAAIFSAARQGVLIKGGNHLESLAQADSLLLDKTGTVTRGEARVTQLLPLDERFDEEELLREAAAAEEAASHPLAKAVMDEARRQHVPIPRHHSTHVHVSRGVSTAVNGHQVRVGSRQFLEECGIETTAADDAAKALSEQDATVIYVARDQRLLGVIGVQDSVREGMRETLTSLRRRGIHRICLLTGDSQQHAAYVAQQIGLEDVECEMQPEQKMRTVSALRDQGAVVVMVGDGINDAPALASANVGVVLGTNRTDVAMEAADVIIAGNDPRLLVSVFDLGRQSMRVIHQNFSIAIGVNTAGIVCGALGWLPLFWSVVLHNSSTLVVVLNSSRLLYHNFHPRQGEP